MSLLNDMLRDLSHQQKTTETISATQQAELEFNAQEQRELFYSTSAAKSLPRTLVPTVVVFVAVLAVLGLWKGDFFAQPKPNADALATTATEPVSLFHSIANQPKAQEVSVQQNAASASAHQSDSLIEQNLGERITALESAITNLSTVVAIANHQADSKVVDNTEATGYEATNYEVTAVGPNAQAKDQWTEEELATESVAEAKPRSVSIKEPFAQPAVEQGESRLSIAPNVKWKDEQQAQQAVQLIAQGKTDIVIEKLQHFIATAQQPRESMKVLLDVFIGQENTDVVRGLLEQASYLSIVDRTFYAAKVAVAQHQDAQAILLLESHLDEAEQNENYRSLLAGLYQRTGLHLEAANHYRRLLSVFGDKPAYWLGFALSQDALNQPQVATQAFQRVNQYADLQPQVRTYIQQRIAALQQ